MYGLKGDFGMKKRGVRLLCLWIATVGLFASCGQSATHSGAGSDENGAHVLYTGSETAVLQGGARTSIPLNADVGNQNHLTMSLTTDVDLVGYIRYEATDGSGKTNEEKIFIEKGATEFSTFLDAFRVGAKGAFEKRIRSIELQNVETVTGKATVQKIGVSDRAYDQTQTLFIQDEYLKIGARLGAGGALTHVEKLNANVVEYIDEKGVVRIESGVDKTAVKTVTDEVNLVNIYDWGREIQQSYYIAADKTHGYEPKEEQLWPYDGVLYNPVQAGSAGDKQSQIIDYTISDTEIWVKTRPQEWFFDNTLSDSYMENRYTLADGALLVSNRFINFSGFTGTEQLPLQMQEMPAIYIAHPLDYFYCETIDGVIKDNHIGTMATKAKTRATQLVEGQYHYALEGELVPGGWIAYANDKDFGLGIYMPNAMVYLATRNGTPSSYDDEYSHKVHPIHDLSKYEYYPSTYVFNYGYLCPNVAMTITEYTPVEYGYAIYAGQVTEMRAYFNQIKKDGMIENKEFIKR